MKQYELIYAEPSFNQEVNNFLSRHIVELKRDLMMLNCEFMYLPNEVMEKELAYFFPQITESQAAELLHSHTACYPGYNEPQLILREKGNEKVEEIFLFPKSHDRAALYTAFEGLKENLEKRQGISSSGLCRACYSRIPTSQAFEEESSIDNADSISAEPDHSLPEPLPMQRQLFLDYIEAEETEGLTSTEHRVKTCQEDAKICREEETEEQLDPEVLEHLARLRQLGLTKEKLMKYFSLEKPEVSRMTITEDFRIILTDYQDREIKMGTLPKALYFLYLNHPEGIPFKRLIDYREELKEIYYRISNRENAEKMEQSINALTDPLNNSVNEKASMIRSAFLKQIDPTLAEPYLISTEIGHLKRITLNRSMLIDHSGLLRVAQA